MFEKQRITKKSSYDQDNYFLKAFCRWVIPFYKTCLTSKNVEIEDLLKCSDEDESDTVVQELEMNWNYQKSQEKPKFYKALAKTYGYSLLIPFVLFGLEDCLIKTIQPILLGMIVRYISEANNEDSKPINLIAGAISLSALAIINLQHPAFAASNRIAMRAKVAWNTLIYRKCLKLSRSSIADTSVGHIINLMTNDTKRFDEFAIVSSYLLIVPIQTIIFLYIGWQYLGSACLATFAGLIFFIPLITWIGTKVTKIRSKISGLTDYRICLTNDIIRGIRVIKMFGWEQYFQNILHKARENEVKEIKVASTINAITLSVSFISARLVIFLSIITYVLIGGKLNAETIFVTILIFERLRYTMTWMLPMAVSGAAEVLVSCERMQKFLSLNDIKSENQKFKTISTSTTKGISIRGLSSELQSFNEDLEKTNFLLENISFDVKSGEILAVVGPVGSGKTSLLLSILGELDQMSFDRMNVSGSVAYVSQKPFCFNGSIRDNILFGRPFDKKLYNKILYVCALEEDLKQLFAGDQTQIGERGTALSGGQKARINLARSLYLNSDIYLLDDPLSSVDASVAKHIFENCIQDFMRNKCVVLVTNQMNILEKCTKVLCLKNGRCLSTGTYDQLLKSGVDFVSILKDQINSQETDAKETILRSDMKEKKKNLNKINFKNLVKGFNIEDENENTGQMDFKVYLNYFKPSSGWPLIVFALLSALLTQAIFHLTDYWLTIWDTNQSDSSDTLYANRKNIIIYSSMSFGLFIFASLRSVTFFEICLRSSHSLHNKVFDHLLRTSITVFDYLPIGRILNRFTRDIGMLDDIIPLKLFDLNLAVIQLIGLLVVIITNNYYFLIPGLLFASILVGMRKVYIKPSQVMRKFEAMTRSPIYSHISTTMEGLTTIRAFGSENNFKKQYSNYQNDHNSCQFLMQNTARLFGIVLDYICFIFITFIIVLLLVFKSETSDRSAGLVFSSVLCLTSLAQWAIKRSVDLEVWMTSILRLNQYMNLPQEVLDTEEECEHKNKLLRIPKDWPKSGQITIRNLSMTYPNSNQQILKNISLKILSGQKIGIVGRTGSGKSSFINALFRLIKSEGNITIDGINIKSIGLRELRKNISIIPQETTVFSSSLRSNLDPFGEFSDEDLWTALEEVQLKILIESLPEKLETIISEQALNLSVGQKQLICLCRAVLRKNRILILDEATANVDHKTDSLIQKTIKNKFKDCTVIIVAHRIESVIDCDRILVMDEGRVVDDNSPFLLLEQQNSYFSRLVRQTGRSMATRLHQTAQQSFVNKNCHHFSDNKSETFLRQRNI